MTQDGIKAMLFQLDRVQRLAAQALSPDNISRFDYEGKTCEFLRSGKITGSLRRASLDLTRALAEMRKP